MFSPVSGVDLKIIPTAAALAATASVPINAVPSHSNRVLSRDEKQRVASKIRAAYLLVNGSTQLHQKLVDLPAKNRELMNQFDDLFVLAFLVASLFYSPATLNYVIENICQHANNNSWDMQHVGRILALLWRAKFALRIDDTTIYFLPRDSTSGMDSFSIPIRTLSSLKGAVSLYSAGALIYRRHLWHRQSVSQDASKMCLEHFAYDPELREMIIRPAVCANIIIFAMQKGGPAKARDIRLALDNVRNDWSTHPEDFLVPLSNKDIEELDEIIRLMHMKTFQVTDLSRFANHFDVVTAGITSDVAAAPVATAPMAATPPPTTTVAPVSSLLAAAQPPPPPPDDDDDIVFFDIDEEEPKSIEDDDEDLFFSLGD